MKMRRTYIAVFIFGGLRCLRSLLKVECPWIILSSMVVKERWHGNGVEGVADPLVELLGREGGRGVHHRLGGTLGLRLGLRLALDVDHLRR